MKITSPAFAPFAPIPLEYTCKGEGKFPLLRVSEVPQEAKSLALILDDPDAVGGLFTHLLLWNISPEGAYIDQEHAIAGINSAGVIGFTAPCPPPGSGIHRYIFSLLALSSELDLPSGAIRAELEEAMKDSIIDKAQLIGQFGSGDIASE